MRNDCDDWQPVQAEVEYLSLFGTERDVVLAIGTFDSVPQHVIGALAGFSGGTTTDPEKRRTNLRSAVSKTTKRRGKLLPHIAGLCEQLKRFRTDGGKPNSVSWLESVARIDYLIRHGSGAESMRAIDMKAKLTGTDSDGKVERFLAQLVAEVGPERARRGLEEFNREYLIFRAPELFAHKPDDIEQRIAALETEHADHDGGRSLGNSPGDPASNGSPAVSNPAAGVERSGTVEVTRGPAHRRGSSRAGDDVMRDADGKVLTKEELRVRQAEIFGL